MNEEIKLCLGEDGVFREYNDEFDITLHFENKNDQELFFKNYEKGQNALEAWSKVLNDINDHAIEFEAFGITDDYISVGIMREIIYRHCGELQQEG